MSRRRRTAEGRRRERSEVKTLSKGFRARVRALYGTEAGKKPNKVRPREPERSSLRPLLLLARAGSKRRATNATFWRTRGYSRSATNRPPHLATYTPPKGEEDPRAVPALPGTAVHQRGRKWAAARIRRPQCRRVHRLPWSRVLLGAVPANAPARLACLCRGGGPAGAYSVSSP